MIKEITLRWLEKNNACMSGIDKFIENKNMSHSVYATVVRCYKNDHPEWVGWLLDKLLRRQPALRKEWYGGMNEIANEYYEKLDKKIARKYQKLAEEEYENTKSKKSTSRSR